MADIFNKWIKGLEKTRKVAFGRLATLFGATEITWDTWDELEAILVQADLGIETTQAIIASLIQNVEKNGITKTDALNEMLVDELAARLDQSEPPDFSHQKPSVIMVVGVNGSGKTTSLAKLGKKYLDQHQSILFGAADTYRAAAVEQLQVWGDRLDIPVIAGQPGADPGAVTYDAIRAGIARKSDLIFIDTAGRLHTRFNLMEELKKVHRVAGKAMEGAPHATWLVLDATTGQNALHQAKAFNEAVKLTGVILTKLDSSARGGMAFAIQKELHVPILFAGLGEKPEDMEVFDKYAFVKSIIS